MDDPYKQLLDKFNRSRRRTEFTANTALSKWNKDELRRYAEKDRNTILHRSCFNGWYDVSIRLIEEFGLDPNARDMNCKTALHWASRSSNVELVLNLISVYKCHPFLCDIHGNTPLHWAIVSRSSAMVQSIIKFCRCGSLDIKHMSDSIMTTAWQHWNNDIIKCLINEGECSLGINNGSTTILHECVAIKTLVSNTNNWLIFVLDECHCGDVNIRDKNGDTILHKCASMGLSKLFKDLVSKYNCKPDIENNKGETPLHIICSSIIVKQGDTYGSYQILYYLLMDAKVPPHVKFSNSNISVLSAVCKAIHKAIKQHYNYNPLILRYLIIDCGCDPSNDSDLISYILCDAISKHGLQHIDVLYHLIVNLKLDPHFTLSNGGKVCIMCCPIMRKSKLYDESAIDVFYIKIPFLDNVINLVVQRSSVIPDVLIEFLYYFFTNVKCRCDFQPRLIDSVKEVYSANRMNSILQLKQLVKKFGFKVDTSHDSLEDATLKDIYSNTDVDYTICLQNPLHSARVIICCLKPPYSSSIYSLFYDLIKSGELDLMSKADIFGNTLLHLACLFYHGDSTLIEYLLSTGKIDPLCVNDYQQTPLTLLTLSSMKAENNELNIEELITKFGKTKVSHAIESYVNIIILGNPGVGKSTFVKVINDRHDVLLPQFRSVTGVELCTAGIVPHVLNDKDMGEIIVHDLAGQLEYYSSHTAVISNLLQESAGVFVIVVSLANEKATESLQFWLSIVENACSKSCKLNHLFVLVSHHDANVRNRAVKLKKLYNTFLKLRSPDIICHANIFSLDCRKLGGGQLDSLMSSLSGACESIRSNNVREMSLYCHMLYDFLRSYGKAVFSLNELVEAIKTRKDCYIPTGKNELINIIQSLTSTGLVMVCLGAKVDDNNDPLEKVWIIADKSALLENVNGVLFAPEYFKEHVYKLVKETGIVKLAELSHHFSYDPDMIVQFLESMELCHEISKDFIFSSNLFPSESVMNERYLFIPALIKNTNRPDNTQFQFGWCLQCSDVHTFFLSQFIHLIILHLLVKFTKRKTSADKPINRHKNCHIWNNGIQWSTRDGVSALVEVFDSHKYCVLLMSFESGYYEQMSQLRKAVIGEILSCKSQVLFKTSTEEFVIDNTDLQYPQILDKISTVPKYSIHEFCKCHASGKEFVLQDLGGGIPKKVDILLQGTNIREQCESVLAGRNPKNLSEKVTVHDESIDHLTETQATLPSLHQDMTSDPVHPSIEGSLTDTTVYSVTLKYRPQLLGIISDPNKLAVELVAKRLLSPDTQDRVSTTTGISRYDKANIIMNEIVRYFEQHVNDCESFLKFCQVLMDHGQPGLDELAKEMEQTVHDVCRLTS